VSAWFYKKGKALLPADEDGERGLSRMEDGECVLVSVVRVRCPRELRRYYAICSRIGENQDPPRDKDSIDRELRIRAGHFDVMFIEGHEIRSAKRIAFEKLSQEAWEDYWRRVELAISLWVGAEYLERQAA
jgi:hypothetical protein